MLNLFLDRSSSLLFRPSFVLLQTRRTSPSRTLPIFSKPHPTINSLINRSPTLLLVSHRRQPLHLLKTSSSLRQSAPPPSVPTQSRILPLYQLLRPPARTCPQLQSSLCHPSMHTIPTSNNPATCSSNTRPAGSHPNANI